jgi:predicted AAA+ superfamily ATPase
MSIYHRKLEEKIRPLLHRGKALIIVGARQVGKSTMLQNMDKVFGDALWLNADENSIRDHLSVIDISGIRSLVGNYKMVIIDEIQRVKNAGLILKMMVDNFKDVQFIATGSSALEISETVFEPLTGRFFLFHLYPFSLAEIYPAKSSFEIEQALPFHLVYGNYPEVCTQRDLSEMIVKNLAQQYLYKDVLIWKDIRRPELLDKLLKLLAFQIGSQVSINELARSLGVKSETVRNYIDLLEKSFVIYQLKSFGTNQRKEVSKMSKVYFWDNGIRNAVIGNFDPLSQRTDTGALFENFIISERLKMLSWSDDDAKGFFWRNYNKSEVDYIERKRDLIKAFEIKWNTNKQYRVSRAFTNLYPNAETQIVTPSNLVSFVFNE